MKIIETRGNKELLNREKTLFLCSKRTPVGLYEKVFSWTDSLTAQDCIACFNSTDMEAEMLKALLVSKIPTVLFVMNRFTDVNNIQIELALQEHRILIVVLKRDEPRGKGQTPRLRNEYVLSLCQHVVCGYINANGSVFPLLAGRSNVERLVNEDVSWMAAEPYTCHERWTVAQDKVLLRMYYADMGIHAIHKKLHRTHLAIYTRIRSITQPEEFLKGREFEDYVLSLFNIQEEGSLVLMEWQSDKSLGDIQPESNSNPDFIFRQDKELFAIECKWRERLKPDLEKDLFPPKRIENYRRFSETRKIPVTIVLGVGGEPCAPESLYAIPLDSLSSIISNSRSIVDFIANRHVLTPSMFINKKKDDCAYTVNDVRKDYPYAYKPWSDKDDKLLMKLYEEDYTIVQLSETFGRERGAIESRLKKLRKKIGNSGC